jgi:MSHA biogenesis protein MshO
VDDTTAGVLTRHADCGFSAAQATSPGSGATVADKLSGCAISFEPGAGSRNGLVTVQITLSDGGESISLLQQIHVLNSP